MSKTTKTEPIPAVAADPTPPQPSSPANGPSYNPAKGKAAFEALRPRLESLPKPGPRGGIDTQDAALLVLAVIRRVREPELHQRIASLPKTEFDLGVIDLLEQSGWATWYAHVEFERVQRGSEAQLPASLVEEAVAIEKRMQDCCEYYFMDDPGELGKEVKRLRAGSGHHDLASDLLGYSEIYAQHHDMVSSDRKNYRPGDRERATVLAEQMLDLLGDALGPAGRTASVDLGRAFDLMRRLYEEEVRPTGLWLLRKDPEREQKFPALYSVLRAARTPRKRAARKPAGEGQDGGDGQSGTTG